MLTPTRHLPEAFCQSTCGRCPYLPAASTITQHHSTVHHDLPVQATNSTFIYTSQLAASRSLLASCSCTDTQPDSTYTCAQQKAFGKCSTAFVGGKGFCQTTCGRCQCNPSCSCDDVQPAGAYTCAQQVNTHCSWMELPACCMGVELAGIRLRQLIAVRWQRL